MAENPEKLGEDFMNIQAQARDKEKWIIPQADQLSGPDLSNCSTDASQMQSTEYPWLGLSQDVYAS